MKFIDLTGKIFGRLTVVRRRKKNNKWNQAVWICTCICSPTIQREFDGDLLRGRRTTSCGCFRREFRRLKEGEASRNRLYRRYKTQADKELGFYLTIVEAEILFKGNCYYCGQLPNQISYAENMFGKYTYNGIDRRNNKVGYTVANCVSCCGICNHMKWILGEKEFIEHVRRINEHTKGNTYANS
jgi:hypothetical protein